MQKKITPPRNIRMMDTACVHQGKCDCRSPPEKSLIRSGMALSLTAGVVLEEVSCSNSDTSSALVEALLVIIFRTRAVMASTVDGALKVLGGRVGSIW